MTQALPQTEIWPALVRMKPVIDMSDEQFLAFCQLNRDLRIERTADGELLIMPPTGGQSSRRNAEITIQLGMWARRDGSGVVFDSSAGFSLPNGAIRSPDASWVRKERLAELSDEQKLRFLPLCPDFVIELRSRTDSLRMLQSKMNEYLDNGAKLGWLIDPETRFVHIYKQEESVELLENTLEISGGSELPGFTLDLHEIWEPDL